MIVDVKVFVENEVIVEIITVGLTVFVFVNISAVYPVAAEMVFVEVVT